MDRTTVALLALMSLLVSVSVSAQQNYPNRPIRFIVPFAPGGGTDYVGRLVARKLGERLGHQLVVENRAGAGGAIGSNLVARATPDGYTLLLGMVSPLAISPNLENVPYDPVRDFSAASLLASSYHVLVVHPSLPVKSLKELVALAKSRPGQINYGSAGTGTNLFLIGELFKAATGTDIVHIPYKGTGPAVIAILSGESQMMFGGVTGVMHHVSNNRLRAIAVTSPNRSPLLPQVPTLIELGLRGVDVGSWYALLAPAGTPRPILDRLSQEIAQVSTSSDYRKELEKQAFEILSTSPDHFAGFMKEELAKWAKVIKIAGIKRN
ncbi:MAG: tripartite tricarboxylate transporter substrate binding protein [Betaproteobacteria bacterium]|nr:tripartite tricarboxylate transporter substrate binding protein [Betaproteobacteria bacterium]